MPAGPKHRVRGVWPRWIALVPVALVLAVVAQNAWACDDAFITLRVADHFLGGRGLVFNDGWRVQAYTHPLQLAIDIPLLAVTGSGFWTAIVAGLALSAAALGHAFFRVLKPANVWACGALLLCSRAFVEYSTSGLENSVTHLVLALAAGLMLVDLESGSFWARHRVAALAGCVSAAFLSRPDAILLLAPALALELVRHRRAGGGLPWRELLLGASPLLAWELFSLVYYGALIPNTGVAKLGVGIARVELAGQGLRYLQRSLLNDPVTVATMLVGVPLSLAHARSRGLALGALCYLLYVVSVGGDFMEGRFLTPVFFALVLCLGARQWPRTREWSLAVVVAAFAFGAAGERLPLLTGPDDVRQGNERRERWGIADERSYYAAGSSLWAARDQDDLPRHRWRDLGVQGPRDGSKVAVFSTMGYYGFFAAPDLHVVDGFALADPFLARLPALRRDDWRPGHFGRRVPRGYVEALHGDATRFEDPALVALFEDVERVHTGPLFREGRLAAMWRLNAGHHRRAIDRERYARRPKR